jgi:CO dehydrogenase nickel-insertion accessory protein CooC1
VKKIIATGKGGVGKTTTLTALSMMMAREGKRVIVFDTDPSMNLALSFGIPYQNISTITEDKAVISHELEEEGIEVSGEESFYRRGAECPFLVRHTQVGNHAIVLQTLLLAERSTRQEADGFTLIVLEAHLLD